MKKMHIIMGNDLNKNAIAQRLKQEDDCQIFNSNIKGQNLIEAVKNGKNVIVETLLKDRQEYIKLASQYGYKIEGHICVKDGWEEKIPQLKEGFHEIYTYKNGDLVNRESRILIATTNPGKIEIYSDILKELGLEYCTLRDLKVDVDVEEDGKNEIENSQIKAKTYHNITDLPVIANDSGLIIEKFKPEDQPGVFVRRYGGRELGDEETIEIFSKKLEEVGGESDSYFNVALTICNQDGDMVSNLFKSYRYMIAKPSKTIIKGLPLRSLDFSKELNKYLSEISIEESNKLDAKCIDKQAEFIKECFKNSNNKEIQ